MKNFFYQYQGDVLGPVSGEELRRRAVEGFITTESLVRVDNSEWTTAVNLQNLFDEHGNAIPEWPVPKPSPPVTPPKTRPIPATPKPPTQRKTDIFAVLTMGCGAFALVILPILFAPLSIIFSLVSYQRMAEDKKLKGGWQRLLGTLCGAWAFYNMLSAMSASQQFSL